MATMFDNTEKKGDKRDEYDASNKKVIDNKTIDMSIKKKKYGPFFVELAKLGDDDMCF